MIKRTLHISWITLAGLLLAVAACYYYVGWTESGLRAIGSLVSRQLGRAALEVEQVSGTLAGGARIGRFSLRHPRTDVTATDLELKLAMLPLLWQTIRVERVAMAQVEVKVHPRRGDEPPWKQRFIPRLLTAEVGELRIAKGQLINTRGKRYDFESLLARGLMRSDVITIESSELLYADILVRSTGLVRAALPIKLSGNLDFDAQPEGQPRYHAVARMDGDLAVLPMEGEFNSPFNASFKGAAKDLGGNWWWEANSTVQRLDLTAWDAGDALGVITGQLHWRGDAGGYVADGELLPPGLEAGPLQTHFEGNYADRVLDVRALRFVHRSSGSTLDARGAIGVERGGPRLDLTGRWSALRWPMGDVAAPLHDSGGDYRLSGVWPYALEAQGVLQMYDLPQVAFTGSGLLHGDRLEMEQSRFEGFGGAAELTVLARWSPAEVWQATGRMRDFDIGSVRPGVRGRLHFDMAASGEGYGADGTLRNRFSNIAGQVRGQRAGGQALVTLDGEDWLLEDVDLQLGATRIAADGRIGTALDLRFDLRANDLALLHPEARGQLNAWGTVRGGRENPLLKFTASGGRLQWSDLAIGSIEAKVDFDPMGNGNGDVSLRLGGLSYGGRTIDELQMRTDGKAASHEVSLSASAERLKLEARGSGGYSDGLWSWNIASLQSSDQRDLQLRLEAPAQLVLGATRQSLSRLCLRDENARFCLDGSRDAGGGSLQISSTSMPLRALLAGTAVNTDFTGSAEAILSLHSERGNDWYGTLRAQIANAAATHRLRGGRTEIFTIGTGTVNAELSGSGLAADVALNAGQSGFINGRFNARPEGESWREWPLGGELRLQSDALSVLDSYIASVDKVSGQLDGTLQLSGTLAAPQLNGELAVKNAEVDAYQVNMQLRELNFIARLEENRLSLSGSAKDGIEGKVQFSGNLAWRSLLPYGEIKISGEELRVINVPEARVRISPDVQVKIDGRRIDVTGTIAMPYARLEPVQYIDAVLPSSDVVRSDRPTTPPEQQFKVFSNVTLKLGERVTINTLGLSGRLSGSLTSTTDETGISRGRGELVVEEGKYAAYGRQLDIERGRLLFSNGPVDDPALDIRASKRFTDVTAGVRVTGTLQNPRTTFYSDPALSQSRIASLLISGGSLDSVQNCQPGPASGQQRSCQSSALLQGSAILAQRAGLTERLGDVSIESTLESELGEEEREQSSLVLGRYLSPRLYLSYGVGLAETLNTWKMRYTIGDRWTIRYEDSRDVDRGNRTELIYTIEK